MIDNLYDYKSADRKLALGMDVCAFWSKEGYHYREKAVVVKLDSKSVTVRLQGDGRKSKGFNTAKQIELPRFSDQTRWSWRNCVWPLGLDMPICL